MINRLWWMDPGNFLALIILPIFVASALIGGPYMPQFGTFDFLTTSMILLGALCVIVMATGAKVGTAIGSRARPANLVFDQRAYDLLLKSFLIIAVAAYALLLGRLIADPTTVISVLQGERGAIFGAKARMSWLVGITSLTNITPLVVGMSSVRFVLWGSFLPSRATLIPSALLGFFILVHAFIGSERLVLLENGIAFALPLLTFVPRLKIVGRYAPILGLAAVVIIFAVGEYMRSWAYYSANYDSFAQFAGFRLLAYLAVASNTGAGMLTTMPPVGYPLLTARWFNRLPIWDRQKVSYQDQYFQSFGNIEFNNPGGIMSPLVDFGIPPGIVYLFLAGIFIGLLYGLYRKRHAVGLLAYPLFFIGLVDLTQIWFWGEPRFFPRLIILVITILLTVRRQVLVAQPAQ